jgi:uncharacterized membrane protein YozB (DUF420 family)
MTKKPWLSKTIIVNSVIAVIAFFPGVSEIVTPEILMSALAVVNVILRLVTKDKISLSE